jgi:KDO2-lipid IV(A) lauroyltransferase
MVAEVPRLWGRPHQQRLGSRVQWRQVALLDQAVAEGKGLMVLTGHLGCFEIVAQAYAERHGAQHPITALYRPSKQPWLADLMVHARNRPGMVASPATLAGVRQMLRALKSGHTVGILPDQVPAQGLGEWAPFFGRSAYTMTMAGKLMAQTGCSAVVLTGERLGLLERLRLGCDYVVHVRRVPPEVEALLRQGDAAASAIAINRLMQEQIMQFPCQYLWGYNRYKGPRAEILTSATLSDEGKR